MPTQVRPVTAADSEWVARVVADHFGSQRVVSRGVMHDALALPGLIEEADGERRGLALYRLDGHACELVVLVSVVPRRGVATRLVGAIAEIAGRERCTRLWLVTTNDNLAALAFYSATGWRRVAVHKGAVNVARQLKPEIPLLDASGRAIEDEIEFELPL